MPLPVKSVVVVTLFLFVAARAAGGVLSSLGDELQKVCDYCAGPIRPGGLLASKCLPVNNTELQGRCCVENSTDIIGLDLSACPRLNPDPVTGGGGMATLSRLFSDVPKVRWVDLSNNTDNGWIDFGGNFSVQSTPPSYRTLQGLVRLETLVLTAPAPCPGPIGTWAVWEEDNGTMVCSHPVPACSEEGEIVYFSNHSSCGDNSVCIPDGPGFRQCVCKKGYWGYRCLRQGDFRYGIFFTAVIVPVLAIIACPLIGKIYHQQTMKTRSSYQRVSTKADDDGDDDDDDDDDVTDEDDETGGMQEAEGRRH